MLDRTLLLHAALQRADSGADEAASAVHSLELCADDFVNSDALPSRAADGSGDVDFDALYKDLPSLLALYERNVLSKVAPSEGGQKGAGQESRGGEHRNTKRATAPHWARTQTLRTIISVPALMLCALLFFSSCCSGQPLPYAPAPSSGPSPDAERQPQRGGEGFDPLRIYRPQRGGPFAGDIDPLTGGPGGNLMGPQNFPGGPYSDGRGAPRPGVPGMAPRFDPYGPIPGVGNDPDFDEMLPPGPGGPLADIGGPLPRGPGGPRRGGMGGPGMGGLGGPRGGFGQGPFGGGGGFPGGRGFM